MAAFRSGLGRRWRAGLLSLVGAVALVPGCTTIPRQEFQDYRETFDAARVASESVLADYGAVRAEAAGLVPPAADTASRPPASLSQQLGLDAYGPRTDTTGDDALDVRLAAWDVAGQYNDALLALASGASDEEVGAAVNGLLDSLQAFPAERVAELAGGIVPYSGVVADVLQMIQQDVAAGRFREAVRLASPLMHDFIELLGADAALFRQARVALLDQQFDDAQIAVVIAADRARAIVAAHGWSEAEQREVKALLGQVNAHAVLAGDARAFEPIELPAAGVAAAGGAGAASTASSAAADLAELQRLAQEVEQQAGAAHAVAARLQAYCKLMDQYAELVRELSIRLGDLAAAVERDSGQLPSVDRLERILSNVHVAQEIYTQAR